MIILKKYCNGLLLFIFCLAVFTSVQAAAPESPVASLKDISGQVLQRLQQNRAKLATSPKIAEGIIDELLLPHVDLPGMARAVLGRSNWMQATPLQQERFINEFRTTLIRTYATAFAAYNNETIEFLPLRGGYENKDKIQVDSYILQKGGPRIPVSYRMVLKGDEWKVYDLIVDNVSLLQSFNAQFAGEIPSVGMEKFLDNLENYNEQLRNKPLIGNS